MREMNASACDALASGVRWDSPALIASLVGLGAIDAMVVGGNCLVIAAVFVSSKLRSSVTNLFIASLAVADLLLGLAVLPFSAAWEVFDEVWLFGDAWCSVWLAVDVWMCTASILNLCAISLDRYVAVTRPVSYPSIMSCGRAKMLIAGVWVLSFLICFPPLVGWNDHREDGTGNGGGAGTRATTTIPAVTTPSVMDATTVERSPQPSAIPFEDAVSEEEAAWLEQSIHNHILLQHHPFRHHNRHHQGFPSSSSSGESSWSPMANASAPPLRLLQRAPSVAAAAAAAAASSLSSGGTVVASSPAATLSPSELIPCPWVCELTNDAGYVVYSALGSFYIPMFVMLFFYWRIYRAAVRTTKAINQGFRTTKGSKLLGVGFGGGSGSGGGGGGGSGSGGNAFGGGGCSRFDEHRLTLRIHRGRGSVMHHGGSQSNWGGSNINGCNHSTASAATASSDGSPPTVHHGDVAARSSSSPRRLVRSRTQDRIRINVTYQPDGAGGGGGGGGGAVEGGQPVGRRGGSCRSVGGRGTTAAGLAAAASSAAGTALYSVHYTGGSGGASGGSPTGGGGRSDYALRREGSSRRSSARFEGSHQHLLRVSSNSSSNSNPASAAALQRTHSARHRGSSAGETELMVPGREVGSVSPGSSPTTYESMSVSSVTAGGDGGSPGSSFGMGSCSMKRRQQQQQQQQNQQTQQQQHVSRMGKRNIKAQVKRFRMETKAAKTLGIIVGGFIVCWLPFFTMYLVRAFCEDCIPPLVFSVLFWLGYCNSAINPCIYALFSKDFRFAFKRIICRCFCTGRRGCTGGWSDGAAEAGGAFGAGGSWGSFRRRSNRQSNQQQPLPSGQPPQRRLWRRDKKRNRSPPAWLLASTWARRTSGGGAEDGDGCGGNGVGANSVGDDSEGGGSGNQAGGGARNHNGNVEVVVTSDSR